MPKVLMNISLRLASLFLCATLLLSTLVFGLISNYHRDSNHHLQLAFSTCALLILIGISGKLLHYQHELHAAKQNLDEAQQLAAIGSWEWDITSGKTYWSDNCYRLFNLAPSATAPGQDELLQLIHPDDRNTVKEATRQATHYGSCYEVRYRLANDPENKTYLSRGKLVPNAAGNAALLVGSVQDITHKVRREQLREELVKQKDLFISKLGHDLKTPLTPLVTLLPLIQSRSDEPRQKELLQLCINSASHINELVVKTLRLARLSSDADSSFRSGVIDLVPVINSAISALAHKSAAKQIHIQNSVPPDLTVFGNQSELTELFEQIIDNAIKYSPTDSQIQISATLDQQANIATIDVNDNGIGLLPEEQEHIFEDFFKADTSRHSLESSGLGLAICQRIIENHGGSISAHSPGKNCGTTISFTLKSGGHV
jgi:signal transduction histidine kinase